MGRGVVLVGQAGFSCDPPPSPRGYDPKGPRVQSPGREEKANQRVGASTPCRLSIALRLLVGKGTSLDPLPAPAPWKQVCRMLWGHRLRHGVWGPQLELSICPVYAVAQAGVRAALSQDQPHVLSGKVEAHFPGSGG